MDERSVQAWLDRYIEAWRENDAAAIVQLFGRDAEYRYRPADEAIHGPEAIAASWLEDPEEPKSWDAWYRPFVVEGHQAAATGVSTYFDAAGSVDRVYDNVFLLTFNDDGQCTKFTEWFVERPAERRDAPAPVSP
jgi:hypothetical protein